MPARSCAPRRHPRKRPLWDLLAGGAPDGRDVAPPSVRAFTGRPALSDTPAFRIRDSYDPQPRTSRTGLAGLAARATTVRYYRFISFRFSGLRLATGLGYLWSVPSLLQVFASNDLGDLHALRQIRVCCRFALPVAWISS
jgi:hypothetical protein